MTKLKSALRGYKTFGMSSEELIWLTSRLHLNSSIIISILWILKGKLNVVHIMFYCQFMHLSYFDVEFVTF